MNIRKSCRRPVVSLLYATKSAFTAHCHIPDRWSCGANWIWPDLAFGFVQKRSGNEITQKQPTKMSSPVGCFQEVVTYYDFRATVNGKIFSVLLHS